MFGLFKVLMPVVTARMLSHQLSLMIQAEAVGISLEHEIDAGITRRHRIVVRVQRHAAPPADQTVLTVAKS